MDTFKLPYFDAHTHQACGGYASVLQVFPFDQTPVSGQLFSAGLHPEICTAICTKHFDWLEEQLGNNRCVAVGECGLDNRFEGVDEEQEVLFIHQLKLAAKYKKPIILHCVNRVERCLYLHQQFAPNTTLIYHGFNKPKQIDLVLKSPNVVLSIGASVCTNLALQECVPIISIDRLLVETDTSTTTLDVVYEKLADLKKLPLPDFTHTISENAKRIFFHD
jgi:TatD DNase family protein